MNSPDKPYVGKMRNWHAYLSVAANGPLGGAPMDARFAPWVLRPKVAADLTCTIPDVTYWEQNWQDKPGYRGASHQFHKAEFDVDYAKVAASFEAIGRDFAAEAARQSDFEGGLLTFCYSGHGREGDGALCLKDDTTFSADDFIDACLQIRRRAPGAGRMRVAALLDSCYSGAFILRVLESHLARALRRLGA